MNPSLKQIVLLLCTMGLFCAHQLVFAQTYRLHADTWARPRTGETLLEMPEIRQLMQQWHKTPERVIEIHYPGGEQGMLWAQELRDWLVSLGVPSAQIKTLVGHVAADSVDMLIHTAKE